MPPNPVTDRFQDWQADADTNDTNLPTNATFMSEGSSGDLDGELRRIKSEVRIQGTNHKFWERYKGLRNSFNTGFITFSYVSPSVFSVNTSFALSTNRRLIGINADGSYCLAKVASYAIGGSSTTVTCTQITGAFNPGLNDVWLGIDPTWLPLPTELQSIPHSSLVSIGVNDHHAQLHALQHTVGGTDPFSPSTVIDAMTRYVYAAGQQLLWNGMAHNSYVFISGSSITYIPSNQVLAQIGGVAADQLHQGSGSASFGGFPDATIGTPPLTFLPSFASGSFDANDHILPVPLGFNPGDTAGRIQMRINAGIPYWVAWGYLTNSDNPVIWTCKENSTGQIKGTWTCDDGLPNDAPGLILPTCESIKVDPASLAALSITQEEFESAEKTIKDKKWSMEHIHYRALQAKLQNKNLPEKNLSDWLLKHTRLDGNKLIAK